MFFVATLFCFLAFTPATLAQNVGISSCQQCYNSIRGAQWLENEGELCSGCDPEVIRHCRLSSGHITRCLYVLSCNVSSCSDHWGPWTNISRCNNDCGQGFQKRQRICLRVKNNTSVRGTLCRTGYGRSEQDRNYTCTSFMGCEQITRRRVTTRPASSATTTTIQRSRETTTTTIRTTTTSTIEPVTTTPRSTASSTIPSSASLAIPSNAPTTTTIPPVSALQQSLELPIILGSVAVICICIAIIIGFLIIFKRRSANRNSSTRFEGSGNGDRDAHHYNSSTEAVSVQNVLYMSTEFDKDFKRSSSTSIQEIPEGTYAEPSF